MTDPKARMKRLCLTLDDYTIAEAKRRGDGNVSLGIRRAFSPPQVRGPDASGTQDVAPHDTFPRLPAPI